MRTCRKPACAALNSYPLSTGRGRFGARRTSGARPGGAVHDGGSRGQRTGVHPFGAEERRRLQVRFRLVDIRRPDARHESSTKRRRCIHHVHLSLPSVTCIINPMDERKMRQRKRHIYVPLLFWSVHAVNEQTGTRKTPAKDTSPRRTSGRPR